MFASGCLGRREPKPAERERSSAHSAGAGERPREDRHGTVAAVASIGSRDTDRHLRTAVAVRVDDAQGRAEAAIRRRTAGRAASRRTARP
jgi:hypothetical protein